MRTALSFLSLAASVSAATISIDVGKEGSLKFDPDSTTAAIGDTLEFHFYRSSGPHSVVTSSFSTPCIPATDAFFSGYIPGSDSGDQTFVVAVNTTDPIWFYCSLGSHCQEGMVGVVNPPSGQTVVDYAAAAQKVSRASAPASLQGGMLTTISPSAGMSSSSTAAESTNTNGRETSAPSSTATSVASTSPEATNTVGRESTGGTASPTSAAVGSNTSTSASASAATTSASASAGVGIRERSDVSTVLGLAIFAAGLVALMV